MVVVDDVHKWFGNVHAVRGVSFELPAGTVAGLLGHNGAGKSTTIRMVAGYITPDAGKVSIAGHDMTTARLAATRQMGYLPESTPLYPEMPTRDYLEFRGRLFGLSRAARRKRADEVIERCWLKDVRDRRVGQLSKGYKQRVGLAASLLHEPRVLLLDEPTSGLDPSQVRETRDLVRELAQDRTMLISSHVLPEVEAICNRVIIFAGGKVRAAGRVQDLASSTGAAGYVAEAKLPASVSLSVLDNLRNIAGVMAINTSSLDAGWTSKPRASQATFAKPSRVPCPQAPSCVNFAPKRRASKASSCGFSNKPHAKKARSRRVPTANPSQTPPRPTSPGTNHERSSLALAAGMGVGSPRTFELLPPARRLDHHRAVSAAYRRCFRFRRPRACAPCKHASLLRRVWLAPLARRASNLHATARRGIPHRHG